MVHLENVLERELQDPGSTGSRTLPLLPPWCTAASVVPCGLVCRAAQDPAEGVRVAENCCGQTGPEAIRYVESLSSDLDPLLLAD